MNDAEPTRADATSAEERALPPLSPAVLDPRPALFLGTIAWTLGLLAMMMVDGTSREITLCFAGVGVGLAGSFVYYLQRRAVRRGAAGAQQGLDFDDPLE